MLGQRLACAWLALATLPPAAIGAPQISGQGAPGAAIPGLPAASDSHQQAPIELQGDEPLAQYLILRFMQGHPDLFWRLRGRSYYTEGNYVRARECFERAARFSDKPSQAMLGEMHWNGLGGPLDRELGYAWMDLAAERLYEDFYVLRERYWSQLDAAQRERAIKRGQSLLREYGDRHAKPRLAKQMKRERPKRMDVGGFFGNLPILPATDSEPGGITLRGSEYFDDTFWEAEAYFAWQDTIWRTLQTTGEVEVGAPRMLRPPRE